MREKARQVKEWGEKWFVNSGAQRKQREVERTTGLRFRDYLKLHQESVEDMDPCSEFAKQIRQVQADVDTGRTDATTFHLLGPFIKESQVDRLGYYDYVNEARSEITSILYGYLQRNRTPGYVQGMNMIVCTLLCFMDSEESFWTFCTIVEDIRMPDFYSQSASHMHGFQVVCRALQLLVEDREKVLIDAMGYQQLNMVISLFSAKALIPLFTDIVPLDTLIYIWDDFFSGNGDDALIHVCLALLSMIGNQIRQSQQKGESSLLTRLSTTKSALLQSFAHSSSSKIKNKPKPEANNIEGYTTLLNLAKTATVNQLRDQVAGQRVQLSPQDICHMVDVSRWQKAQEWTTNRSAMQDLNLRLKFTPPFLSDHIRQFAVLYARKLGIDEVDPAENHYIDGLDMCGFGLSRTVDVNQCMSYAKFHYFIRQSQAIEGSYGFFFRPNYINRLVEIFDQDRSGYIDFKEVMCYIADWMRAPIEKRLLLCFRVFNEDDSGLLTMEQFRHLKKAMLNTLVRIKLHGVTTLVSDLESVVKLEEKQEMAKKDIQMGEQRRTTKRLTLGAADNKDNKDVHVRKNAAEVFTIGLKIIEYHSFREIIEMAQEQLGEICDTSSHPSMITYPHFKRSIEDKFPLLNICFASKWNIYYSSDIANNDNSRQTIDRKEELASNIDAICALMEGKLDQNPEFKHTMEKLERLKWKRYVVYDCCCRSLVMQVKEMIKDKKISRIAL